MPDYKVYFKDDWSALYVNGKLVKSGADYSITEWLMNHFNVERIESDAFITGEGKSYDNAAKSLEEIELNRRAALAKKAEERESFLALLDSRLEEERAVAIAKFDRR